MLCVYGAYVGPMLIHVRLLHSWGHIRALFSLCYAKNGVFLLRIPILKVLRAGNLLR